jgi:hypothetical protein
MFAIDHRQTNTQNLLATGEPSIDIKSRVRYPVPPTHLGGLRASLLLTQYSYDLFLAEATRFHLSFSSR